VDEGFGVVDDLLSAVYEAAGIESDSSGGAALSDGVVLEAVADSETCAACDLFPDDKGGSTVEAVMDDEIFKVGGKE